MKDIIEFLNTAGAEELTQYPEISSELADAIIAARPILDRKDSKRVKGFSFKKFDALKAEVESGNTVVETPEQVSEIAEEIEPEFPQKKSSAVKILWRVLVALLVIAAIFSLIYFGVPWFRDKVLNPLQNNTERVSALTSQQEADIKRLSGELESLQERITSLEGRADAVDVSLASHAEMLAKLEEMQLSLQASLETHKTDVLKQMDETLTLTRAIELLARSRLYLSQSNFGLAKMDISAARDLLYGLLSTISSEHSGALRIVIERLDLALSNLPAYPVVAVFDLDLAWQYLVDGLPNVPEMVITPVISETQASIEITPTPGN